VDRYNPPNIDREKAHTVARLKAVFESRANQMGQTERDFLSALVVYWGTVSDLIQRQEHGAHKEGESLGWQEARRVVFHVAFVMYEIDRAIGL